MEFSRQEYWSGLPFPNVGNLSDLGLKRMPLISPPLAGRFLVTAPPGKPYKHTYTHRVKYYSAIKRIKLYYCNNMGWIYNILCSELIQKKNANTLSLINAI